MQNGTNKMYSMGERHGYPTGKLQWVSNVQWQGYQNEQSVVLKEGKKERKEEGDIG